MPRSVAILGSTGSIGRNTLDVISVLGEGWRVAALAAGDNAALLSAQIAQFRPALVSLRTPAAAKELRQRLRAAGVAPPRILTGPEGLLEVASAGDADLVVAATVGIAGLRAVHAAIEVGSDIALANKEALVVAGSILVPLARARGVALLPVDSEHSAIHQCLRGGGVGEVERLILTASGGALRHLPLQQLPQVTPAQALRHPTWAMGPRVTLDSATLMNKGFEIIEACHLFGVAESQVEVVMHPQSIVHSLVEFRDGSILAQLGTVDMRTPIQYALTYPERLPSPRNRLKLEQVGKLDFESPDLRRYPCLELARAAFRSGPAAGVVLNAADEVALEAFASGRLSFDRIPAVIASALDHFDSLPIENLDAALWLDGEARARTLATITARGRG